MTTTENTLSFPAMVVDRNTGDYRFLFATTRIFPAVAAIVIALAVRHADAEMVDYEVVFDASWSQGTHPTDFPRSPHFSGLIGGTHTSDVVFWEEGGLATDGIKQMAETGGKTNLQREVEAAISDGTAHSVISGGGIGRSPGQVTKEFSVDAEYPLVTLVSMIAPSPDWFVGVSGMNLMSEDRWQEEIVVDLVPYDAGTDSGITFSSPNSVTNPPQPISHLTDPPVDNALPFGTFTFRLLTEIATPLQAGDADRDFDFDQFDLIQIQSRAQYLSGSSATWGDGDWNGAPGGSADEPPVGDGVFDQLDIIAALDAGVYLTGPYAAIAQEGQRDDGQTSIVYVAQSGEISIDAPNATELTSINITSSSDIFLGDQPAILDGAFDNYSADNVFKATFGGSFGSLSFGEIASPGLSAEFLQNDLTVVGSLAGGGDLGDVDLVHIAIPEPATIGLAAISFVLLLNCRSRSKAL